MNKEQETQILLVNNFRTLLNSIKNTADSTITRTENLETEEIIYLQERIKIFEQQTNHAKLNKKTAETLKKTLSQFIQAIPSTATHAILKEFKQKVIIPTEETILQNSKNQQQKYWTKSNFSTIR